MLDSKNVLRVVFFFSLVCVSVSFGLVVDFVSVVFEIFGTFIDVAILDVVFAVLVVGFDVVVLTVVEIVGVVVDEDVLVRLTLGVVDLLVVLVVVDVLSASLPILFVVVFKIGV